MARVRDIIFETEQSFFEYKEKLIANYYLITYGYEVEEAKLANLLSERTGNPVGSWRTFMLTGLFGTIPKGEVAPFYPTDMQVAFERESKHILDGFVADDVPRINFY